MKNGKQELETIKGQLRQFAQERNWEQFHSPKNLATALVAEAGELVAHFQWLTEEQSKNIPVDKITEIEEEIADVLIYLVRLADKLNIDLFAAAQRKIGINAEKYPVEKVKGSAKKYTEY